MPENLSESPESQSLSPEQLTLAINNNELSKEEVEDAIVGATEMAKLKQSKGELQKVEKWKAIAEAGRQKIRETNPELTKTCPGCGLPNRESANFCRDCGTQITESIATASSQSETDQTKSCSRCGHVNRPQARFCAMCGNNLG